jgi:hypothetical protein
MARLQDVTHMIRSKNAGPFSLTIDILFDGEESYRRVRDADILNRRLFAGLFKISENLVRIFHYDPANAIKVTVPRYLVSGDVRDPDVFGGQQYAQLVDLEIPDRR